MTHKRAVKLMMAGRADRNLANHMLRTRNENKKYMENYKMAIRTVNALYEHAEKKGWAPEEIAAFHRKRNDKIVVVARRGRVNA